MKAASEFVLSLLLILILVSAATVMWLYYYGYLRFIENNADTSQFGESISSCMKIESMNSDKIYIKNCGDGIIRNDSLAVYVDEQQFGYSMDSSLSEGQIGTVRINTASLALGGHYVKVTSENAQDQRYANLTLVSGNKALNLLELV
jgi:hypothetical protein